VQVKILLPFDSRVADTALIPGAQRPAVRWDMVPKKPFADALLPKKEKKTRAIWAAEIIRKALDNCSNGNLTTQNRKLAKPPFSLAEPLKTVLIL